MPALQGQTYGKEDFQVKNRYAELRQRQRQEVNALPIGFAFSDRQFEEMMRGWGLDREYRRLFQEIGRTAHP